MKFSKKILLVLFSLIFSIIHSQTTINIPADYSTIQLGLDAASEGDTVLVLPGVYLENINFNGKNIVLTSNFIVDGDTAHISNTIIDGNKTGPVVTFENGETVEAQLIGFTLQNGSGKEGVWTTSGGGIFTYGSSPSIRNTIVRNNTVFGRGAGFYSSFSIGGPSTASLTDVEFYGNICANDGGAIYCNNPNPFTNLNIHDNVAKRGAGIFFEATTQHVNNLLIHHNDAERGGGIFSKYTKLNIVNSTIITNSATLGGGMFIEGNRILILNSIFENNGVDDINLGYELLTEANIYHSNIPSAPDGIIQNDPTQNIHFDSTYVKIPTLFINPDQNNYKLDDRSPVIGHGVTEFEFRSEQINIAQYDIENEDRPQPSSSNPDLGAYENPRAYPKLFTPTLLSLSNGATNQPINPTLVWNSVNGAEKYKLQLTLNEDFSSIEYSQNNLTDTLHSLSNLSNDTQYFWRVQAYSTNSSSEWSEIWNFTTIVDTPSVVTLQSPLNGSTGNILPIIAQWHRSSLAETYRIQLSTDVNFTTLILDQSNLTDTSYSFDNLDNLTVYYWRVSASNIGGVSNWSEVWSFKTLGEPTTVSLLSPENLSVDQPIKLDFLWSSAKDQTQAILTEGTESYKTPKVNRLDSKKLGTILSISNYWFELTKDINSSAEIVDSTLSDTTKHISGLNNLTDYWWRVRAKNETGWGGFTQWSKFKTMVDTPAAVILQSPSNGSISSIQPIELAWNKSDLAISYRVQVSEDINFSITLLDSSDLSDTKVTLQMLNNLTQYYWRVSANNIAGTSDWSVVWSFTLLENQTNYSLKFDGTQYVSTPHSNSLELGNNKADPFTIECWFSVEGNHINDWIGMVSKTNASSTTDAGYRLGIYESFSNTKPDAINFGLFVPNGNGIGGEASFNSNLHQWYHMAAVYNGAVFKLFLNGEVVYSYEPNNPVDYINNDFPLTIGGQNGSFWNRNFNGFIDEVRISSVARYSSEFIPDIFFESDDSTKLLFHFNEGNGSVVYDVSNNSNIGNIFGATWSDNVPTTIDPPNAVALNTPLNNSDGILLPTTLKWHKSENTDNYKIQVSADSNFITSIVDSSGIIDTSLMLLDHNGLTNIYWRISARNRGGTGEWSEIWNFTTLGIPNAPTLISPEDNISLPDTVENIKFIWNSVESAESYTMEASANELFDSLIVSVSNLADTSYSFSTGLSPGVFYWRVNAKNLAGIGDWSEKYTVSVTLTSVDDLGNIIPQEYVLHQNFPNPFNPSTVIKYGIPEQSNIKIEIFNMLGQSVGILVNTEKSAGFYETTWDASNLTSGIYLFSIRAEGLSSKKNFIQVKKAILLK